MSNPFEEINHKLDTLINRVAAIEGIKKEPPRIPFKSFCEEEDISRPTGYAWAVKKLIQLEKIGGRLYVIADSIKVQKKYQRKELA